MSVIDEIKKDKKGITLIALVVTIIVLLILAGITVAMLFGEHGVIKNAQTSNEKYKIAQAREKLELVLNTDAAIEKRTNPKYNQDDFLDELILSKVSDTKVLDNIVITDGYAFELDRDVPKLGAYIGKESELVFPTLQVTNSLSSDYKTATITINTQEDKNGISKIEIIQGGFVIKEYTYDNIKEPITENFEVKQNGTYVVKVYSKLSVKDKTEVNGLVSSIEYSPNGDETYKKEHKVKVTVKDTGERIKSIKYQWLQTTVEPAENTFIESCNDGDTITKNGITGIWYLWTLLETESGKKNIGRSETFYFDNQAPTVKLSATPKSSTECTITATCTDHQSKTLTIKVIVGGKEPVIVRASNGVCPIHISGLSMGEYAFEVQVSDECGNTTSTSIKGRTKMYTWNKCKAVYSTSEWKLGPWVSKGRKNNQNATQTFGWYTAEPPITATGTRSPAYTLAGEERGANYWFNYLGHSVRI